MASAQSSPGAGERRAGHLVIIGGNEDRLQEKHVLRRFVELTGSAQPRIVVLGCPGGEAARAELDLAFADLGVAQRLQLTIASRDDANDPKAVDRLASADGLFIPGSDAHVLLALLGGTAAHDALRRQYQQRGRCVAATGAGAQVLSQYVMLDPSDAHSLAAGLGLVQRALVDPRFSERQRLSPLLALVAVNPQLIGIGIDEDTALVVEPDGGIEVVGDGAVTLIDGREMHTYPIRRAPARSAGSASAAVPIAPRNAAPTLPPLELVDVKLHLLPAGTAYACDGARCAVPPALRDLVEILTRPGGALS
jgi:cyanophycinase